jgi:hypothetical protein
LRAECARRRRPSFDHWREDKADDTAGAVADATNYYGIGGSKRVSERQATDGLV